MSNYRSGIAIANQASNIIVPPTDSNWWTGYADFICNRYDPPKEEKEAAKQRLLPLFLYWNAELVFHYFDTPERCQSHLSKALPQEHPYHTSKKKGLLFGIYRGDYWLNALFSTTEFWLGLHKAGTRGTFVLEVGCEHEISFQGFKYNLYGAAWPAWYLLIATLDDNLTLEKIYPFHSDITPHQSTRGEGCESSLHFFYKYKGKMIDIAKSSPLRENLPHTHFS